MAVIQGGTVIEGALKRVWSASEAPTSGTDGTLAGIADTGDLLSDVSAGTLYINTGSKASPTWTVVGTQS